MKYIHETIIRDIIDLVNDVKDFDSVETYINRNRSIKSISSKSANLTAVFPVFCSNSISASSATMVTKAMERKNVSMLEMLFAAQQVTNLTNGEEYLKQFHSNLRIDNNISVDSVLGTVDKYVLQMESVGMLEKSAATNISIMEATELLKKDSCNLNSILPETISENSLNSFKIKQFSKDIEVMSVNEYTKDELEYDLKRAQLNKLNKDQDYDLMDKMNKSASTNADIQTKYSTLKKNLGDDSRNSMPKLIDSDVKKANELVPSMVQVTVYTTNDKGIVTPMTFLIGVKAKLYNMESKDIITRVISKHKDTNFFLNFVRATTREISFFRDFMFGIDQAKIDALSQSKRGSSSKIWKVLERRAKLSKIKRNIAKANDAMAISTLVVSQEDIEYIKSTEGIDLEKPSLIRPILESYNLMCFVIVDELTETCKFIFDTGEDLYEYVSFSSLERESGDGAYKKVINLMNKISR